jgi:Fe-coproporphyrin III synthase
MFRLSQHMRGVLQPEEARPPRPAAGPVVIWNLTRRCNLRCRFCYSGSANVAYAGELTSDEALGVMKDLRSFRVPALILSGGEPLLRPDIFELSGAAKAMGFYVALSTNGTRIEARNISAIVAADYDYVGISIDGIGATHDRLRGEPGSFATAMRGLDLCQEHGLKVGLRFTLTRDNAADLPVILKLIEQRGIDKFYLSHLNYGGRGNKMRADDAEMAMVRAVMDRLFETCCSHVAAGLDTEFVTGNNDADGVYFLHWVRRSYPERAAEARRRLEQWGGNASGVNVANIDNRGFVHPDSFWWDYRLGNVRDRPFSAIWSDLSDPLLVGLRARPRPLKGRCAACAYQAICNGNARVRAVRLHRDPWQEDPGCYLSDAEIGVAPDEKECLRVDPTA